MTKKKLDIVALNKARDAAFEKEYPEKRRSKLSKMEQDALTFGFYSGWKLAIEYLTEGENDNQ